MSNWAKFAKFGPPRATFTSTKSTAKQIFLIPARWLFLGHRSTAWGKSEVQVWWKFHLLGLLSSTVELHFAEKSFFEVADLLRSWFKPPFTFLWRCRAQFSTAAPFRRRCHGYSRSIGRRRPQFWGSCKPFDGRQTLELIFRAFGRYKKRTRQL